MGYYTRYNLEIVPRPAMEDIERFGAARRVLERESFGLNIEMKQFFSHPINEAIYQALFNESMVYALGKGLAGGGDPDSQWRDHEEDMRKLSAAAPDHLFILSGVGEEPGDQWRKYFKRGLMQEARSRIEFDDFDETKLA